MASAPSLSGNFLLFIIIIILFFCDSGHWIFDFSFVNLVSAVFLSIRIEGFVREIWGFWLMFFVVCGVLVVPLECVSICKLAKGDGSGRYDCNILSCAWKAPRVLTGFLASTAHPPQCSSSSSSYARNGRRTRTNFVSSLSILIHWFQFEKAVFMFISGWKWYLYWCKKRNFVKQTLSFVCRC